MKPIFLMSSLFVAVVFTGCSQSPTAPSSTSQPIEVATLPVTASPQILAAPTSSENAQSLFQAADGTSLVSLTTVNSAMAENVAPAFLDPAQATTGPAYALMTTASTTETLPDGTTVATKTEREDRGTTNKTDDLSVVTKTYTLPNGDVRVEKITRPVTPLAAWNVWGTAGITTTPTGSLLVTINGFKVSSGTISTTYRKVGTAVSVAKVYRVEDRVDRYGVLIRTYATVVYNTDSTRTESRYSYRYSSTGVAILIHSFVHTLYTDPQGITWTKLLRDDGWWWLTRKVGEVSTWKLYNPSGVLRQVRTETKIPATGEVVVHVDVMNPAGTAVLRVIDFTLFYNYTDGMMQVRKKMADGQSYVTLIREAKDGGYDITLGGVQYHARTTATGVVITDKNGVSATITFGGDGTWTITYANGQKVTGRS